MNTSLFILLFLALLSCSKKNYNNTSTSKNGNSVTLAYQNCTQKTQTINNTSICFQQVLEDSRCPANVNCIWSGIASAKFLFQVTNTQYDVALSTYTMPGKPSQDTIIAGYKIKLVALNPYPGTSTEPTTATVEISQQP